MKVIITKLLVLLLASAASAQEWQRYQLTHYEGAGSLGNSGCVADSFGNLHHYFICSEAPQGNYRPLYYMRTDFYGHVLTDTIRVNGFAGPYPVPSHANVVGDGSHSWCVFTDRDPHDGGMYLYMTERDSAGNEVFAPRQLGRLCS